MQVRFALPEGRESAIEGMTESLIEIGAIRVEVIDDAAQMIADFDAKADPRMIRGSLDRLGVAEIEVRTVERPLPQYWRRRLAPVRVGSLVVTSVRGEIDDGVALVIEPGMASGTAHLEGTVLCLETLIGLVAREKPSSALDVGTGTGLLAIAALLLGVERAVATDIDPHALAVARRNACLNGVESRLALSVEDPADLGERFELVLANLPDEELLPLLPSILGALTSSGHAVLTATSEVDRVLELGATLGGEIVERIDRDGWACLVVRAQGAD